MLALKIVVAFLFLIFALFVIFEIKFSKGSEKENADILLILGCRVKGDKAEETLAMRIEKATEYLLKNKSTIAIACGGIVHDDQTKSEAEVIRDTLVSNAVESERIILEDKSLTTMQNFINTKKIIESMKDISAPSVAVLSSEFHLLRALLLARRCKFKIDFTVAANSPKDKKIKNYLRELVLIPIVYFTKRR